MISRAYRSADGTASGGNPNPLPREGNRPAVWFYPHRPRRGHWFHSVVLAQGWQFVLDPDEADWRVLYHLDTLFALPEGNRYAAESPTWLNGRCTDISKRRVELDFANVFGYELAVDPTVFRGRCVSKSDVNCIKDARVLDCPIPASAIQPDQVYERLVDGLQDDGSLLEYRLHVVGGTLPIVRRKRIVNWHTAGRLDETLLDAQTVPAETVFSTTEIGQLREFSRVAGLDLGALDVIRDVNDGRIYVLDVTKTPGTFYGTEDEHDAATAAFGRAWLASFPPAGR